MKNTVTEIHQKWLQACRCHLKEHATQGVPGVGNPKSDIVFIGEAPGKSEDAQGEPFVGRAGQFLNEMLSLINRTRNDVYITNIVKYRPPDNRDPSPEEIRDCLPWLMEELQALSPHLLIPLGRHALNRFFPEAKISDVHGKLLKRKITFTNEDTSTATTLSTEYFFPLYHPAAALYNGGMRTVLENDFKKIPQALEKITGNGTHKRVRFPM